MKTAIALLIAVMTLSACQRAPSPCAENEKNQTLPYGKWKFAFLTPHALPALVTHVRFIDTVGYLNRFYTLDATRSDPNVIGSWENITRSASVYFNRADYVPRAMIFCWDSIIDMQVYETSITFPLSLKEKMSAAGTGWNGKPAWFDTLLFGLAPEGKVKVWLQNSGGGPHYVVPVTKLNTVSGNALNICRDITKSNFSYGYDQDIKDFIKGKTYPYGQW